MPALPEWFPALPQIIAALESVSAAEIDRPVFESVFGVHRRRAFQLLHEFGGRKVGLRVLANRKVVLNRLCGMKDQFEAEEARKRKIIEELETARRLAPGRKVRIDLSPGVADIDVAGLPASIHLRPGELRIEFFGAEDLCRHLYALSQAMANDYARFAARCEEPVIAKAGKA